MLGERQQGLRIVRSAKGSGLEFTNEQKRELKTLIKDTADTVLGCKINVWSLNPALVKPGKTKTAYRLSPHLEWASITKGGQEIT